MRTWGLVLGGGGLTGTAFHAGVIAALHHAAGLDARHADLIVGTSAGAAAAALVRAGFPPADYVTRILGGAVSPQAQRVLAGMRDIPPPPPPLLWRPRPAAPSLLRRMARHPRNYPLGTWTAAALPAGRVPVEAMSPGYGPAFQRWPDEPMWLTAVSLRTGARVVFGRDRSATVAEAVSASCAIPGYFAPVVIDDEPFVDGGAHSYVNLDLVAGAGVDTVIVSAPLTTSDPIAPDAGNAVRSLSLPSLRRQAETVRRGGTRVVLVAPDRRLRRIMGLASMSLARRPRVALAAQHYAASILRDLSRQA